MDQLVAVAYGAGELEAIESVQIRLADHLPAEKLLEPVREIEERYGVHSEGFEWKDRRVVRPFHDEIEVRHRKAAARLGLAVVAEHRSAVADASGNPDIAPSRFACDGEFELPLDA